MSFAFCARLYATPHQPWHIREVPDMQGLKLGGGAISTPSLCGYVKASQGRAIEKPIIETHLKYNTCGNCLAAYRKRMEKVEKP